MTFNRLLGGIGGGGLGGGPLGGGGGSVGDAVARFGVDTSGVRGQMAGAMRTMQQETQTGLQGVQQTARNGWGQVAGIARAGAFALAGVTATVIGTAVTAAVNYETAFAGVIKTVDASGPQLDRLRRRFRELSTEIPVSASELARLGEAAGALGISVDNIEEFVRISALIGVTTDVSSEQAATSLGQLSNVLGLTESDYERFGSTLVDLGNKGASTESQILEIASRSGAMGSRSG